jgi:hypothetical protein
LHLHHGLTKVTDRFPSSTNLIAKYAKSAKIYDFFAVFASFAVQEFLSDINLVKPWHLHASAGEGVSKGEAAWQLGNPRNRLPARLLIAIKF